MQDTDMSRATLQSYHVAHVIRATRCAIDTCSTIPSIIVHVCLYRAFQRGPEMRDTVVFGMAVGMWW